MFNWKVATKNEENKTRKHKNGPNPQWIRLVQHILSNWGLLSLVTLVMLHHGSFLALTQWPIIITSCTISERASEEMNSFQVYKSYKNT